MVIGDRRVKLSTGDIVEIKKETIGQLQKENIWLGGDGGIVTRLRWDCGPGNKMRWWVTVKMLQDGKEVDLYLSDVRKIRN